MHKAYATRDTIQCYERVICSGNCAKHSSCPRNTYGRTLSQIAPTTATHYGWGHVTQQSHLIKPIAYYLCECPNCLYLPIALTADEIAYNDIRTV